MDAARASTKDAAGRFIHLVRKTPSAAGRLRASTDSSADTRPLASAEMSFQYLCRVCCVCFYLSTLVEESLSNLHAVRCSSWNANAPAVISARSSPKGV